METPSVMDSRHAGPVMQKAFPCHVVIIILSARPQEYTMEVYLRQYWTDPRLQFAEEIPHVESLSIPDVYYRDVWTPGQ